MGETESVNHFESDNELQSDPSAEALKQRVTLQGGITEPKVENGAPSKDEALNKATDGDPKAKVEASTMVEAILHNPENVKASEPGGAYKVPEGRMLYKFISTGLEQLMAENPDFAKSRTIQTAYVLSKFFGEFLNFNVSPKEYSSFVDAVYPQETMNESEIKKTFEEKYGKNKDDTKDAYGFRDQCAKTSKDLEDAKGRLEKASAAQKDLLTEEVKFLENKQKNQEKIYKNLVKGKEKADTWEKFLSGLTDKEKDGLQKRSKEVSVDEFKGKEYADAKISAAYVSGVLGIKLEDNDPEKLYAKFLHTRYEDKTVADKSYSLYTPLLDGNELERKANIGILPANTVIFFGKKGDDNKSMVMCAIVGFDNRIRFQSLTGLHEFKTKLSGDDKSSSQDLSLSALTSLGSGLEFKGAFLPEESELAIKEEKPAAEGETSTGNGATEDKSNDNKPDAPAEQAPTTGD